MTYEATIKIESARAGQWLTIDIRDPSEVRRASSLIVDAPIDSEFRISADLSSWRLSELFLDPELAARRLEQLYHYPDNVSPLPFSARPAVVDSEPDRAIANGFAELERRQFLIDGDCIRAMTTAGLWERGFLLAPGPNDDELRFVHVGSDLASRLGRKRITQAIGQKFDHGFGTDDRYYRLSCRQYATVFRTGEPLRHHVDSLIPDREGRHGPSRVNYDRLIVQVRLINGDPALFITTEARPMLLPLAQAG